MKNCYCYLLHCIPTKEFYYGVAYRDGCDPQDLWSSYFTSSDHITTRIELFGADAFQFEVRKIFGEDEIKARKWEYKVLKRIDAIRRSDFINKSNGVPFANRKRDPFYWCYLIDSNKYVQLEVPVAETLFEQGKAIRKGPPKSKTHREKISSAHKGRTKSPEHRENMSLAQKGKPKGSYEEQYGEQRAAEIISKRSSKMKGRSSQNKGKTYEELYGEEKAETLRNIRKETFKNPSLVNKGKTYEEIYGIEEAIRLKKTKTGAKKKEYILSRNGIEFYRGDRLGSYASLHRLGYPKDNPIYQKERLEKDGITVCIQHKPH